MQTPHEPDQQSYFYVVWPEERAPTNSSAAAESSIRNSERSPTINLCDEESEHSAGTSTEEEDTSNCDPSNLGSMAEQAIVYLQKILEATDKKGARSAAGQQKSSTLPGDKPRDQGRETSNSRAQAQHAGMNSSSHNGYNHTNEHSTIPPAKRHCNSAHTMLPVATATTGSAVSQCLECEVKDAEIHTLRRRIQLLKEQVANTNTPPQSHAGVPIQNGTSTHSAAEETLTSRPKPEQNGITPVLTPLRQHQTVPSGYVELVISSGVYIPSSKLDEALRDSKTGTQLARKLMDSFWDKATLSKSTLSARSKFQYQQLDPKIIAAIEAYCLAYDRNTHSRDIHATMTDKCCQARSRKGAHIRAT